MQATDNNTVQYITGRIPKESSVAHAPRNNHAVGGFKSVAGFKINQSFDGA